MALVEVSIQPEPIFIGDNLGDVAVRVHLSVAFAVDEKANFLRVGTDDKDVSPEQAVFLRYDLSDISPAIPAGATVTRAYFDFRISGSSAPSGAGHVRIGHLERDGRWDLSGVNGWTSPSADYPLSTDFPFPTDTGSDVIRSGIIYDNLFMGQWDYFDGIAFGTSITVGDEDYSPDRVLDSVRENPLAFAIEQERASFGTAPLMAFVLDGFEIPVGTDESISLIAADTPSVASKLFIEYNDNPPIITSTPPTAVMTVGAAYVYTVTATDPTSQTVTFALSVAPTGATIDSGTGVITWKPTVAQLGSNSFTVVATDEDGLTNEAAESWTVQVESGSKVRAFESRARPAVAHGEIGARPVVSNPAEPRARPTVRSGEPGARPAVQRGKVRARPTVRHYPAGPRST